ALEHALERALGEMAEARRIAAAGAVAFVGRMRDDVAEAAECIRRCAHDARGRAGLVAELAQLAAARTARSRAAIVVREHRDARQAGAVVPREAVAVEAADRDIALDHESARRRRATTLEAIGEDRIAARGE